MMHREYSLHSWPEGSLPFSLWLRAGALPWELHPLPWWILYALASQDKGTPTGVQAPTSLLPFMLYASPLENLLTLLTTHLPPRTNTKLGVLPQLLAPACPLEASIRLTGGAAGQLGPPSVLGLAVHPGGAFHDKARLTPKAHNFI